MVLTLVALVASIVVGVLGAIQIVQALDESHRDVEFAAADRVLAAQVLDLDLAQIAAEARGYLLSGSPDLLARARLASQRFEAKLARVDPTIPVEIHRRYLIYKRESDLVNALRATDAAAASAQWAARVRPAREAVADELKGVIRAASGHYADVRAAAFARGDRVRHWMLALGAIAFAVLALLLWVFVRTGRDLLEQQAREERQEVFQLLEQVPVGVFVVDAAGTPYYANHRARELLGQGIVPSAELGELSDVYGAFEIGSGNSYPMDRTPIARALHGERVEISDMEVRVADDVIPLHVRGAPVAIRGKLAYAVAAFQDVRELRKIATRDSLTGLPNRGAFCEAFMRERLLAERAGYQLGLALVDLDRFKSVNDTHGHLVGDEVLRRTAKAITGALRRTDVVARWGGEELVVLLPKAPLDGVSIALTKALEAVRQERYDVTPALTVTFSAGAVLVGHGETLESAMSRADTLLYEAKAAGRDRIHTK